MTPAVPRHSPQPQPGRAQVAGADGGELDPLIHAPARLRIMVTLGGLAEGDALTFSRLQQVLGLTAGNLITHLRRLDEAGYVLSTRSRDSGPVTTSWRLSHAGSAALDRYTETLQRLLGTSVRR